MKRSDSPKTSASADAAAMLWIPATVALRRKFIQAARNAGTPAKPGDLASWIIRELNAAADAELARKKNKENK